MVCELSRVSGHVAAVRSGYSCAQGLGGEPQRPAVGGSPAGSLPSEEEQAMGFCWAGFQAAALARGGHVSWEQREPCVAALTCLGSMHETSCCNLLSLVCLG